MSGETQDSPQPTEYPAYCKTISFRDANGAIKQLVFPKALDLDRPKRARTTFSHQQLGRLEQVFGSSQYLVGKERMMLAQELGLSETQIKVWFQNRRTKHKKDLERKHQTTDATAESMATKNVLQILEYKTSPNPFPSVSPRLNGKPPHYPNKLHIFSPSWRGSTYPSPCPIRPTTPQPFESSKTYNMNPFSSSRPPFPPFNSQLQQRAMLRCAKPELMTPQTQLNIAHQQELLPSSTHCREDRDQQISVSIGNCCGRSWTFDYLPH